MASKPKKPHPNTGPPSGPGKKSSAQVRHGGFDLDSDQQSRMPSVTRLLRRKKLKLGEDSEEFLIRRSAKDNLDEELNAAIELTSASKLFDEIYNLAEEIGSEASDEIEPSGIINAEALLPPVPSANEIEIQDEQTKNNILNSPKRYAGIKRASRRPGQFSRSTMVQWSLKELKKSKSKFAQKIVQVAQEGVEEVLYFEPLPSPPGSTQISNLFLASSAMATEKKWLIWQGLQIGPQSLPKLWQKIAQSGGAEFEPDEALKTGLRAAFGTESKEWITFLALYKKGNIEGVIAFVSQKSVISCLKNFPLFDYDRATEEAA